MRFSILRTVFLKELREMLRDRRSLLIMFGVPLLLYPLLLVAFGGLAQRQHQRMEAQVLRVAMLEPDEAPHLREMLAAEEGLRLIDSADPHADLALEQIDAVLEVPSQAQQRALGGEEITFTVHVDNSRRTGPIASGRIGRIIRDYQSWVIEQRLAERDVGPEVLRPLEFQTRDIATAEQRLGRLMAGILPLFLLITGMLGSFFPALNATTTEREHGTLETLLVTPASRLELLLAKGLLVLIGGLLTAGLNMASMSLVMWRVFSDMPQMSDELAFSPLALLLTYVAAIPTLIFFAGVVMIVGLLARSYREANAFATPVMLLPVIAALVGIAEPQATLGLLVTPIANTTVIIREVLTGHATVGQFVLAFVSSCSYAGLLLSAAARLFQNEQLVNPSWEPLSLKGLGRPARRRLPAVDEALVLTALGLLLLFYVGPSLMRWGLLPMIALSLTLFFAVPALLAAVLLGWQWRPTFNFRPTSPGEMSGAALVGLGLIPLVGLLQIIQHQIWTPPPAHAELVRGIFLPAVLQYPILTGLFVGFFAGVCEELLFRGPVQTALLRSMRIWPALAIGAALFSLAHVDMYGFPIRWLLGLVLGYVVWRGGSIWPAMLLHMVYNGTQMWVLAWMARSWGVDATADAVGDPAGQLDGWFLLQLAAGTIALLLGGWLLRRAWQTRQPATAELDGPANVR